MAWLPVSVGVFLLLAGFFSAWDGQAVSVRKNEPDQAVYSVLIAPTEGERFETTWPRVAITGLDLRVDGRAIPALPLPDTLPDTKKERFALAFTVTPEGGETREYATTTPQSATVALMFFLFGVGLRNMIVAGSPISLTKRGVTLPKSQTPMGQVASPPQASTKKARGRKGPPPGKPRRGGGRRK